MIPGSRGFALAELVAVAGTIGLLVVILAVAAPRSRHLGWQAGSIANLHEFAAVTGSYSADYGDQFWSYSWRYGERTPSQYPDLQDAPPDALAAIQAQEVDIIRRRARADMPVLVLTLPTAFLHHLPLADYLDTRLLMPFTVSPGDRNRLLWRGDPDAFWRGEFPSQPNVEDPQNWRWLYSSSYRVPQAFFCPDAVSATEGTVVGSSDTGHFQAVGPPFNFGKRRVTKVNFPSQKVHVFDHAQWQGVRTSVYAGYPFARAPMVMVDGSARVRVTSSANPGFQPQNPRSLFPSISPYAPAPWDPPVLAGVSSSITGAYFWTRGGIQGRDFEGQEFGTASW